MGMTSEPERFGLPGKRLTFLDNGPTMGFEIAVIDKTGPRRRRGPQD